MARTRARIPAIAAPIRCALGGPAGYVDCGGWESPCGYSPWWYWDA